MYAIECVNFHTFFLYLTPSLNGQGSVTGSCYEDKFLSIKLSAQLNFAATFHNYLAENSLLSEEREDDPSSNIYYLA